MSVLREHQLGRIAHRLASLLPGADQADTFVGSREVLDDEVERLFAVPAIHAGSGPVLVTYAQALATAVAPAANQSAPVTDEALGVLLAGLSTPATLAAGERERLSNDTLMRDLAALLQTPELRLLLRAGKPDDLVASIAALGMGTEVSDLKALRLGHAVTLRVSFAAARRILAWPQVLGWQVPGDVALSEGEAGQ